MPRPRSSRSSSIRVTPTASLDARAIRAFFLKTQHAWEHKERVRPIDYVNQTPQRAAFLAKVVGLSTAEFDRYWAERQAIGEFPPIKAADEESVVRFVTSLKGTIGFVSKRTADRAKPNVKVIMTLEY